MHRIFTKLQAIHQVAAVKMMKIMCTFDGRIHKQARWPVVRPPQSAPAPASDVLNNHESLPKRNLGIAGARRFTGEMPCLSTNQQCQSTEGNPNKPK